jgi:hypothetical protein
MNEFNQFPFRPAYPQPQTGYPFPGTNPYTGGVTYPQKPSCFKMKNPCITCAYKNQCENAKE